jgi:hypothetical protein
MKWRHLCPARAWSAAGLLGFSLVGAACPAPARADEDTPRPVPAVSETVSVLDARKAGDLAVEVRGAGQDHVKVTLKNTSAKRLNVLLPPGLVASSAAAQGRAGGGFQSMGLGSVGNRPGGFGSFRSVATNGDGPGFRSVAVSGTGSKGQADESVTVPVGQTVELSVVSVCLNFGIPTPTPRDKFELVDVDDYSTDPRVRKALRSLATYGTSHGVAQSVMWRVCNNMPFELMAQQATKIMNSHEIALAARFVEAIDASGSTELVDPAYLQEGRLFVRVVGEGALAKEAERLAGEVGGLKVMGLPVRLAGDDAAQTVAAPAVLLNVVLTGSQAGETRGRVLLSQADTAGRWAPLGKTSFAESTAASVLDGPGLARALDRAVSSAFVTVKPARRAVGVTTFKVDNRLPFTLAKVSVKTGGSSGSPTVEVSGLGVAPGRSGLVPVQSPNAVVEHVELNGL